MWRQWLRMTSILFVIGRICSIQFHVSKKRKLFSHFLLLHIWNLGQMLNIRKKKMTLIGYVLSKLEIGKDVVCWSSNKLGPEHLAKVNMVNSLKTCTTALPSYCFITLAETEWENIGLSVSVLVYVLVYGNCRGVC